MHTEMLNKQLFPVSDFKVQHLYIEIMFIRGSLLFPSLDSICYIISWKKDRTTFVGIQMSPIAYSSRTGSN